MIRGCRAADRGPVLGCKRQPVRLMQLEAGLSPRTMHHRGGEGDDRPLDAHLFLGLFSYRIVNTIPSKLRQGRKRLLPDKDSPKAVHAEGAAATEAVNALGENEDFYR